MTTICTGAGIWIEEEIDGSMAFSDASGKNKIPFNGDVRSLFSLRSTIEDIIRDRMGRRRDKMCYNKTRSEVFLSKEER
jgi:hypothetical protein